MDSESIVLLHGAHMSDLTVTPYRCSKLASVCLCWCRSQWLRGLRRGSTAARLLELWVRIPPGAWMSVCVECCVLSGRGLWDGLITRPEKSYRLWCVVVCDLGTSRMRRPWPVLGRSATEETKMPMLNLMVFENIDRATHHHYGAVITLTKKY